MGLIDEAIASDNLLQLLEYVDKILEIYGGTRKNERVATIAIYNSLFPLASLYDLEHINSLRRKMIVLRNVLIDSDTYRKIFARAPPLGRGKTELDLFFINVPTIVGHPSEGRINFYVEIEMGDVSSEMQHLPRLRHFFRDKGVEIYPILVCNEYKAWDDTFEIPCFAIGDLEKVVDSYSITSLENIPGIGYEWAATSIEILDYISAKGDVDLSKEINFKSGLWDARPSLRRQDFGKLIEKGRISADDYEDYTSFRDRMHSIFQKMHEKGLLVRNERERYELSIDGRDLLGCYLSLRSGEN
jgi:hypothetical protein